MGQLILKGLDGVPELIRGKKLLLVCTRSYARLPVKQVLDPATRAVFSDFTPNPLYEQVERGIALFRESGCDMIVAVGGGSAIDVAKCIKLFCRMDPYVNYLEQERADPGVPLMAIPTTAGTGSESTRHAVIYYRGVKQSISDPSIIPDYAVLEPRLLKGLPIYQKKCTMLDALAQGLESWWSVNSTEESAVYSRFAVETIRDHWRTYLENGSDEAAEKIQEAANAAGRAINITATTAPHAMSYKLTSLYGLPHGHAVAICLPEVWDYMLKNTDACADPRGSEHLRKVFSAIPVSAAWFRELLSELQIDYPASVNRAEDIELLTRSANPVRLKNNPVPLDEKTIKSIYERIVK